MRFLNPFLNPFQESNPSDSRLIPNSFLPRYARDKETGDRRQGEMPLVALPTHDARDLRVPAPTHAEHREGMR